MKQPTLAQRVRFLAKRARKRFGTARPTPPAPRMQQVAENPDFRPTPGLEKRVCTVDWRTGKFTKDLK